MSRGRARGAAAAAGSPCGVGPRGFALELIGVAVLAVAGAVVWTWPLARDLGQALPYDPRLGGPEYSEAHVDTWNLWHARRVVLDAESGCRPFYCRDVFHPGGHGLALHDGSFFWGLLSLPLQALAGPVFAAGALRLLLLAASAAATWALARALGLTRVAAGFAAFAWCFAPVFLEGGLRHLGDFVSPWPPLFLLFLLRWMDGGRRSAPSALAAGAVLGLALLGSADHFVRLLVLGLLTLVLAPSVGVGRLRTGRGGLAFALPLVLFVAGSGALAWPWMAELVRERSRAETPLARRAEDRLLAARAAEPRPDLLDFFTPPGLHPLRLGPAAVGDAPPGGRPLTGGPFQGLYLAFAVLMPALLAALTVPRARRWLGMAAALLLLCWDPGGLLARLYRAPDTVDLLLKGSAAWFPLALLPLAVASALGLEALARSGPTRRGALAAVVLGGLLAFEYWVGGPYPGAPLEPPPAVDRIASMDDGGAVCVLPFPSPGGIAGLEPVPAPHVSLSWQALHGRPVPHSFLTRLEPGRLLYGILARPDLAAAGWGPPAEGLPPQWGTPDPAGLAIDLRLAGVHHVLVVGTEADPLPFPAEALDAMEGWTRAPGGDAVQWWYRTSLTWTDPDLLGEAGF